MTTYVLIPGAGSDSWYWHLVEPLLRAAGHDVVAVDLPWDAEAAGLGGHAGAVADAIGDRADLVLVAQSLGGFIAPLVCERRRVQEMILVAAMVPAPGESAGAWWEATGHTAARREFDLAEGRDPEAPFDPWVTFLHDVPEQVARASADHVREPGAAIFAEPWPLPAWPDVPTRFLLCRQDRFFPAGFQRRIARDRLGLDGKQIEEMDGGHLPALARPADLADRILRGD
jgi:pimeloyl-ACP methyl ester carboxylesterase